MSAHVMSADPESNSKKTYAAILISLWVLSFALALSTPASWDVAWRLEIAERILSDAVLYRDVIEINPPLWFWSALPSAYLSNITGLDSYVMLCLAVHLIILPALFLLDRSLLEITSNNERMWLVAGSLAALLLVPTNDIGQREPPMLLAGLLWACLAVRRAKGVATRPWLIIGIACFSAYGFALKHYYLIVPIGIEIWLLIHLKRLWRPIRSETIILASLAFVYSGTVLKLAPNFLTEIVPLVQLSYEDVRSATVAHPILHPLSMLFQAFILVVPSYFIRDVVRKQPLAQLLFLMTCLHIAVVSIQGKGFGNHFLAAKGTTFILWAYACSYALRNEHKSVLHPNAVLAVLAFGWIVLPAAAGMTVRTNKMSLQGPPQSTVDTVISSLNNEPKSSRVFIASTNPGLAFYLQWSDGRPHFSRYFSMWMLAGLLTSQLVPERYDAASQQLTLVRGNTITDIYCAVPHLIIGDTSTHGRQDASKFRTYKIEPMTILLEDLAFKTWLDQNYNKSPEKTGVTLWRAKSAVGPSLTYCPMKSY